MMRYRWEITLESLALKKKKKASAAFCSPKTRLGQAHRQAPCSAWPKFNNFLPASGAQVTLPEHTSDPNERQGNLTYFKEFKADCITLQPVHMKSVDPSRCCSSRCTQGLVKLSSAAKKPESGSVLGQVMHF